MMTIHSSQQKGVQGQQQHVPDDIVSECDCTVDMQFPLQSSCSFYVYACDLGFKDRALVQCNKQRLW